MSCSDSWGKQRNLRWQGTMIVEKILWKEGYGSLRRLLLKNRWVSRGTHSQVMPPIPGESDEFLGSGVTDQMSCICEKLVLYHLTISCSYSLGHFPLCFLFPFPFQPSPNLFTTHNAVFFLLLYCCCFSFFFDWFCFVFVICFILSA